MAANRPDEGGEVQVRRGAPRQAFRIAPAPRRRERVLTRLRRPQIVRLLIGLGIALLLIALVPFLINQILQRTRGPVTVTDLAANANGTIDVGDTHYRVTLLSLSASSTVPGTNLPRALENRTYVTMRVSTQNLGRVSVPPGTWTLQMTDDVDRFPLVVANADTQSARAELAPDATNTYTLYFDVPTDRRVKSLFYRDPTSDRAVRFSIPVPAA